MGGGVVRGGGVVFGEGVDEDKVVTTATADALVVDGGVAAPSGERWRSCAGLPGEVCARIVFMLGRSMLICRQLWPEGTTRLRQKEGTSYRIQDTCHMYLPAG